VLTFPQELERLVSYPRAGFSQGEDSTNGNGARADLTLTVKIIAPPFQSQRFSIRQRELVDAIAEFRRKF